MANRVLGPGATGPMDPPNDDDTPPVVVVDVDDEVEDEDA